MKFETKILNLKHKYLNNVMFYNRYLFYNQNDNIEVDKLITMFNYMSSRDKILKIEYNIFRSRRIQIINKLNKDLIKIKYNDIERIIRPYFCTDIKILILEFITRYKPKNKIYSNNIK